jgi:hypothetical protein
METKLISTVLRNNDPVPACSVPAITLSLIPRVERRNNTSAFLLALVQTVLGGFQKLLLYCSAIVERYPDDLKTEDGRITRCRTGCGGSLASPVKSLHRLSQ